MSPESDSRAYFSILQGWNVTSAIPKTLHVTDEIIKPWQLPREREGRLHTRTALERMVGRRPSTRHRSASGRHTYYLCHLRTGEGMCPVRAGYFVSKLLQDESTHMGLARTVEEEAPSVLLCIKAMRNSEERKVKISIFQYSEN